MSDMNGGSNKVPILIGAVVALTGASIYSFVQISDLKTQLAETRSMIESEVGKVNQSTETSSKTTRQSVDALRTQLEDAQRQAAALVGDAKIQAAKRADEITAQLKQAEAQQAAQTAKVAESVTQVSQQVTAVNEATSTNKEKIGAVSTEVAAVRTQAEQTKAELQKTIADLTSTKGDLGIQSGLIAGAASFVGTCGGLAWMAPLLGVPTVAIYDDDRLLDIHLMVAKQVYKRVGAGDFSVMDLRAWRRVGA